MGGILLDEKCMLVSCLQRHKLSEIQSPFMEAEPWEQKMLGKRRQRTLATVTRVITAHRNASALHIHVTAGSRVDAKGNVACWQALPLKLTPTFHAQFFRSILEKIISDTYEILAFLHIVQLVDQSFCH